jgi:hypothetical protein
LFGAPAHSAEITLRLHSFTDYQIIHVACVPENRKHLRPKPPLIVHADLVLDRVRHGPVTEGESSNA